MKRDRYLQITRIIARTFLVVISVFAVVSPLATLLGLETLRDYSFWGFFAYIIISSVVISVLDQLANRHRLSGDEMTFVYTNLTLENLDDYFASKNSNFPERKDKSRAEASKNARKLLSVIEKYWTVGDFELGAEMLGTALSRFKKSLRKRLIPNIQEGDSETLLKEARELVKAFVAFLRSDPSIENLENLTQNMQEQLGEIPVKEKRRFSFSAFMGEHSLVKHSLFVSGITVLAFFVGFLGIHVNVSTDGAYIAAVGLWGVLIVGYFFESRRGKETRD